MPQKIVLFNISEFIQYPGPDSNVIPVSSPELPIVQVQVFISLLAQTGRRRNRRKSRLRNKTRRRS
jgi:hypothetical protein